MSRTNADSVLGGCRPAVAAEDVAPVCIVESPRLAAGPDLPDIAGGSGCGNERGPAHPAATVPEHVANNAARPQRGSVVQLLHLRPPLREASGVWVAEALHGWAARTLRVRPKRAAASCLRITSAAPSSLLVFAAPSHPHCVFALPGYRKAVTEIEPGGGGADPHLMKLFFSEERGNHHPRPPPPAAHIRGRSGRAGATRRQTTRELSVPAGGPDGRRAAAP